MAYLSTSSSSMYLLRNVAEVLKSAATAGITGVFPGPPPPPGRASLFRRPGGGLAVVVVVKPE